MKMNQIWIHEPCKPINHSAIDEARAHQAILTKPANSLGELENIAIKFAGWQGQVKPQCSKILVRVFAGDHGVCAHGVSAFPQAVTAQMIDNFISGGAAISVLSKQLDADFAVVNVGTINPTDDSAGLVNVQLAPGTDDFVNQPAMSEAIMLAALDAGRQQVHSSGAHVFIGGDMGIGNTTSASAIYSTLLDLSPEITVGPGTGVDKTGLEKKRHVLYQAFNFHGEDIDSPLAILQRLGGLEIAGLVGAYISAGQAGIPILVDGFITTAAALLAVEINPSLREWLLFAHVSAEPAHIHALKKLDATPLLDLRMRVGEGSGAAVAMPLISNALALHNEMATFADAGVSASE